MTNKLTDEARGALDRLLGEGRPRHGAEAEPPAQHPAVQRRHVLVVGVVAAVVCAVAGWVVLSARATAVPAAPLVTPQVAHPSSPASVSSATPTPKVVLVHVVGAVVRPGVVRLPEGARVADALEAAGGVRADADAGDLNLAERVLDGAQIKVGTKSAPGGEVRAAAGGPPNAGSTGAGSSAATIDLNTATQAQLEQLPGVGPVTAGRIIEWRTAHGRFSRVEELQEVDGIGPKSYAQIAPRVHV